MPRADEYNAAVGSARGNRNAIATCRFPLRGSVQLLSIPPVAKRRERHGRPIAGPRRIGTLTLVRINMTKDTQ